MIYQKWVIIEAEKWHAVELAAQYIYVWATNIYLNKTFATSGPSNLFTQVNSTVYGEHKL